ncbi:MAG: cytochrome c [Gammaproteobacteria bacterium]|nr:cytochrome c [Gammaproteobacteria bacterium]
MKINQIFLLVSALLVTFSFSTAQAQSDIKIPFMLAQGQKLFNENCSSCHNVDLSGVDDRGPPLLHPYYKPSHHGDEAFYKAALNGTRAHHWKFGDMPAIKGMTRKKMDSIIPYVRYFQKQKKLY